MKVLKVEPGKEPAVIEIGDDLESLQKEVGGYIEAVYPEEDIALICNEEGKIRGLPLNRELKDENGEILDVIAGTFLIAGLGEEDFCSLTDEQIRKYSKEFRHPETFEWIPDGSLNLTVHEAVEAAGYVLNEEAPLQACITNLGKYNEGELASEWISFPISDQELDLVLKGIGVDGKQYEEYFYSDFECDYPGLYAALGEFSNIEDLNALGEAIQQMMPWEREKFAAVMEAEEPLDLEDAVTLAANLDTFDYFPHIESDYELGYYWAEESGTCDMEQLRNYIDYRAFGSDLRTEDSGEFCETGYVRRNREPVRSVYRRGRGFVERKHHREEFR